MKSLKRSSGILMPMSALPSNYGIGSLGKCAYEFVDFLKAAGQSYWQLLPMVPTGLGDSPYSSYSTFAGNHYFIDLDMLIEDGLLEEQEVKNINWGSDSRQVDYGAMYNNRFKLLQKAYERGWQIMEPEVSAFRQENGWWLENYGLYMSLKAHFDMQPWTAWPDEAIRMHRPEAVERYRKELEDSINCYVFIQYLFYSQWERLRAYAREQGISFIGDIPIYVALDSADIWSEPQYFQLDGRNVPTEVSGVPPDAFTDEGQLWGNPLYNWEAMAADGYGWWIRRIDGARKLYDVIRIDHFRGLESYWAVPANETTAKNGYWRQGPGMKLVGVLSSWFNELGFIAEDLGFITQGVKQLLQDSGFPGMKVLQFAFDANGESDYLPHNCQSNSICYVGTHDNDTVLGWLDSSKPEDVEFARRYMHITQDEGWCWGFIRSGMATASSLFVVQMQDVLELPTECRMNIPGVAWGNWRWRMEPEAITPVLTDKLREYTERYRRI